MLNEVVWHLFSDVANNDCCTVIAVLKATLFISNLKAAVPCHYETLYIFFFISHKIEFDKRSAQRAASNKRHLVHFNRACIDYFYYKLFLACRGSLFKNSPCYSKQRYPCKVCLWVSISPSRLNSFGAARPKNIICPALAGAGQESAIAVSLLSRSRLPSCQGELTCNLALTVQGCFMVIVWAACTSIFCLSGDLVELACFYLCVAVLPYEKII